MIANSPQQNVFERVWVAQDCLPLDRGSRDHLALLPEAANCRHCAEADMPTGSLPT